MGGAPKSALAARPTAELTSDSPALVSPAVLVNRRCLRLLSLLLLAWWASPAFGQTVTFTDDPLISGVTPIRAVHLQELRAAINTLRVRYGLSAVPFTDAVISAGATNVRALHVVQLRAALDPVFDALRLPRPTYTDSAIGIGVTTIKAIHVRELRNAVKAADVGGVPSLVGSWRGATSQSNAGFAMFVDTDGVIGIDTLASGGGSACFVFFSSHLSPATAILNNSFKANFSASGGTGTTAVIAGTFSGNSAAGTIDVTFPSASLCPFNPLHVAWTATHTDPGPIPVIVITATDASASEIGPDEGTFTIRRTGSLGENVIVPLRVTGIASSTADYASLPSSVTLPAGQSSLTVTVHPIQDGLVESSETVVVTVPERAAYKVGLPSSAIVTIADQPIPAVSIAARDPDATEAGLTTGTFMFTRTGNTGLPLNVWYAISGTALHGFDYESILGFVTIPAGQSSVTLNVIPKQDLTVEPPETVILALTHQPNYGLGAQTTATITIASDD